MAAFKLLLVLVPTVFVIDLIWLGFVMKGFYEQEIGELMRRRGDSFAPRWASAALVYLVIPIGIVLFVRPHLVREATSWQALAWGAAFGLVLYGVYDLSNRAVLEKWTWRVTVVDMLWGAVLCGVSSLVMHIAERWWRL